MRFYINIWKRIYGQDGCEHWPLSLKWWCQGFFPASFPLDSLPITIILLPPSTLPNSYTCSSRSYHTHKSPLLQISLNFVSPTSTLSSFLRANQWGEQAVVSFLHGQIHKMLSLYGKSLSKLGCAMVARIRLGNNPLKSWLLGLSFYLIVWPWSCSSRRTWVVDNATLALQPSDPSFHLSPKGLPKATL